MSLNIKNTFFFLCLTLLIHDFSDCCTYEEMVSGCRLAKSSSTSSNNKIECLCGIGCQMEFPFRNLAECEAKLKDGQADADPCDSAPCLNGGECIQLKHGRFRCECAGTNFHGDRCQQACPNRIGSNAFGFNDNSHIPLDCIQI